MLTSQSAATSEELRVLPDSTDPGWQYGDKKGPNTIICRFCGKKTSGGFNRFKKHIAHVKGDILPCPNATEEAKRVIREQLEVSAKKKLEKATGHVDSQPLKSSATIEHLTGSQDKISNPSLSRPVSGVDQAAPLSLLENSVLKEPNPNSKFNKHTLTEHIPVKSVTSDILLPFEKTSPLWKTLETTLMVFSCIPQTPHFVKLESECKEKREGMAIGMMVTYANLSESIQRLSIHTEATVFEDKIACIESLEENGFIVDPLRSCLQQLLEIKKGYIESALKRVELETELASKEKKNMSLHASANAYEANLKNIRKSIAELKEKERAIMEERAGILGLTADLEHNILRLREEIFSINRSNELAPEEFERVISKPLVAGCI